MCGSTLFHVLRKQNISLYAFVSSNAVLVKKKGRGIFTILRPFPVGRYFDFYTALSQISLISAFEYLHKASPDVTGYLGFNATGNSLRARPRGNLFSPVSINKWG